MNEENAGIGSVPLQQVTVKSGTFQVRKDEAIRKGHVLSSDIQAQAIRRFQEDCVGAQNVYRPSTNF